MECEPAVGALAVVVPRIDPQDVLEVAAADDQEPVEAFRSDGADESLRVGVRLGPVGCTNTISLQIERIHPDDRVCAPHG
jgi:hypothetical protein